MKHISIFLASAISLMALTTSCNDEWTQEQYQNYISFKAPIDAANGVTSVYVPLTRHAADGVTPLYGSGISDYNLPLIVSGTTTNANDLTVHVAHDTDTLGILNYAWYQNRQELYYVDATDYATYPATMNIKAGENTGLLNIKFDFLKNGGLDMVEKWVLPLTVVDKDASGNSYGYTRHPRKNYGKALLRIFPFNAFSGDYSATTLTVSNSPVSADAAKTAEGSGLEYSRAYAVADSTVFFYAGSIDESRKDRHNFKIYAKFVPSADDNKKGTVEFTCENPLVQFVSTGKTTYTIYEYNDEVQPWLLHRYVIISDIAYTFCDYTIMGEDYYNEQVAAGKKPIVTYYSAKGTMTLGRQINTQIPDEDQAIQW